MVLCGFVWVDVFKTFVVLIFNYSLGWMMICDEICIRSGGINGEKCHKIANFAVPKTQKRLGIQLEDLRGCRFGGADC